MTGSHAASNYFCPEVLLLTLFLCFFTDTADRSSGGFPPSLLGLHFPFGMDRCQIQSLLLAKLAQLKLPVILQSELLLPCTSYSSFPFSLLWYYSKSATAVLLALSVFQLLGKSVEAAHRAMFRPLTHGGAGTLTSQFRRGSSRFSYHLFPPSCLAHTATGFVARICKVFALIRVNSNSRHI